MISIFNKLFKRKTNKYYAVEANPNLDIYYKFTHVTEQFQNELAAYITALKATPSLEIESPLKEKKVLTYNSKDDLIEAILNDVPWSTLATISHSLKEIIV